MSVHFFVWSHSHRPVLVCGVDDEKTMTHDCEAVTCEQCKNTTVFRDRLTDTIDKDTEFSSGLPAMSNRELIDLVVIGKVSYNALATVSARRRCDMVVAELERRLSQYRPERGVG